MYKKIIIFTPLLIAVFILGNIFGESIKADFGEVRLTPQELSKEMKEKNVTISVDEAIKIAKQKTNGEVIAITIGRLGNLEEMGYKVMVLSGNKTSLEFMIIHATTGKILHIRNLPDFQITAPVSNRTKF